MKTFHLVLVPGLVAAWLVSSPGSAKEPDPTVVSVLAKWEEASQKCKTLDAKLTVWKYDGVFGDGHPTITQGRFYYEAPNVGRYEIRKDAKGATNDWASISEAVIWTGKETLWIDGDRRHCQKFSAQNLRSNNLGWWSVFGPAFGQRFQEPKQFQPFLIGIPASELRARFDVAIKESGVDIWLRALPKRAADAACCSRIDVILSTKTYMTVATQTMSPNGRDRTVVEFVEPKVNVRPSDRDQLMAPDLSELSVTEDNPPLLSGPQAIRDR